MGRLPPDAQNNIIKSTPVSLSDSGCAAALLPNKKNTNRQTNNLRWCVFLVSVQNMLTDVELKS